ncbi:MAG TPA: hypothetical protein VFQ67_08975 [Allosphingosinicella sp.]|jgi:hypothetical protein|nr:hypothetical protein [Allosphingosinicella sp.]
MTSPLFLRRALALDSASCALLGLLLSLDSAALAGLFGLGERLLFGAGLLLLPLSAFIAWLASRPSPPQALVWVVIAGNLAWTAESFLLVSTEAGRITALGTAFVAGQALAVLATTALEYAGLRRMSATV